MSLDFCSCRIVKYQGFFVYLLITYLMNKSTIIGKLEVLDLGWDKMSWTDAMALAEELGRGYRLPCPSELRKIYPNLTKTERHWTDYEHWLEKHIAYSQEPMYHKPMEDNKQNLISVILVRDLSDEVVLELLFDSF